MSIMGAFSIGAQNKSRLMWSKLFNFIQCSYRGFSTNYFKLLILCLVLETNLQPFRFLDPKFYRSIVIDQGLQLNKCCFWKLGIVYCEEGCALPLSVLLFTLCFSDATSCRLGLCITSTFLSTLAATIGRSVVDSTRLWIGTLGAHCQ